ncbi:MAG: hypothetical protein ACBR12_27640 [Microcoleus sp.]
MVHGSWGIGNGEWGIGSWEWGIVDGAIPPLPPQGGKEWGMKVNTQKL